MTDDHLGTAHLSVRAPGDVVERLDRIAAILERDRSWVIVRALRHYLDREGREILEDEEAIAALRRGEGVPAADVLRELDAIVEGPQPKARRNAAR